MRLDTPVPPPPAEVVPATDREPNQRKHARPRSATIDLRRLPVYQRQAAAAEAAEDLAYAEGVDRPKIRGDCENGPRPCPFVSCRHHLYLDVHPRLGTIKVNFPDVPIEQMAETCSLDIADRGGAHLDTLGRAMNLTRERVRQLEEYALTRPQVLELLRASAADAAAQNPRPRPGGRNRMR